MSERDTKKEAEGKFSSVNIMSKILPNTWLYSFVTVSSNTRISIWYLRSYHDILIRNIMCYVIKIWKRKHNLQHSFVISFRIISQLPLFYILLWLSNRPLYDVILFMNIRYTIFLYPFSCTWVDVLRDKIWVQKVSHISLVIVCPIICVNLYKNCLKAEYRGGS